MLLKRRLWVDNTPAPLTQLCLRVILNHLEVLESQLQGDVFIPSNLAEQLILLASEWGVRTRPGMLRLLEVFQNNPVKLSVKCLVLAYCPIPNSLLTLKTNKLRRLELRNNFPVLNQDLWKTIKYEQVQLEALTYELHRDSGGPQLTSADLTGSLPNLRHLHIKNTYEGDGVFYNPMELSDLNMPILLNLNLDGVRISEDLLMLTTSLVSLSLNNITIKASLVHTIVTSLGDNLKQLSLAFSSTDDIEMPGEMLRNIVENMPNLKSLDLSGTSLVTHPQKRTSTTCDIFGLESRMQNPLDFLGIFFEDEVMFDTTGLTNIPAARVAASDTEERLLLAGETYLDRCDVMVGVVKRLLAMVRANDVKDVRRTVELVVAGMEHHLWRTGTHEEALHILGAANLFYLVRNMAENGRDNRALTDPSAQRERGEKEELVSLSSVNIAVKKRIMRAILNSMEKHESLNSLIRNGVLAIWQFNIPDDPALLYREIVDRFLFIITTLNGPDDEYIQRSTIILLNRLVCKVEGEEKKYKGGKIVLAMMGVIEIKLHEKLADEVMEVAWSVLWNITDETPEHSLVFLNNNGMDLFLRCKETFTEQLDLLRNMMGLLGNVAEDKACRVYLMNSDFIEEFSFLLDSHRDGIEVSYNAAGVISHLACDGPEAWKIREPKRDIVLTRMCKAIKRWPVESDRNINYRSLIPILSLLDCESSPECQLWAAWAVANLSSYDNSKYAKMTIVEGGEEKIKKIKTETFPESLQEKMQDLVNIILVNTKNWRQQYGEISFS